jgi:4-amino-4-deoxy-L-arabinose transferase-like glycosyltransferase
MSGEAGSRGFPGTQIPRSRLNPFVWAVLAAALALRLGVLAAFFWNTETCSGDGAYYIDVARNPWRLGIPEGIPASSPDFDPTMPGNLRLLAVTSVGPAYPVYLLPFYTLIADTSPLAQFAAARLGQAALDTLTVLFVYLIARRLFDERAARVALVAQALDLRYVFTAGAIATETLFLMIITAVFAFYISAYSQQPVSQGQARWAGVLMGLALLTRPVALLFPLLIILHGLLVRKTQAGALRAAGWMTAMALLVITPWVIRTSIVKGEFVPISDTYAVHFWRASREDGREINSEGEHAEAAAEDTGYGDPAAGGDATTEGDQYASAALRHILQTPLQWAGRILKDTGSALLQPYGTVILSPRGISIKATLLAFLQGEASMGDLLGIPGFWRRLLMYIWHAWGLAAGTAGFVLLRRRWRDILPLGAWVVYIIGTSSVLLVEPRYLFPAMFAFTILAAYTTVRFWDAVTRRQAATTG